MPLWCLLGYGISALSPSRFIGWQRQDPERGIGTVTMSCVSTTVSSFMDARVATAGALLAAGARHVVVMDGAYHGHTTATIDLSPYKFNGPGGSGKCVPTLCCYRMGTHPC